MNETYEQLKSDNHLEVLFDLSKFSEAERNVRLKLASDPENPELYYQLGRALLGLNQLVESQRAFLQSLAFEPAEPYTYFLLSIVSHQLKQFDSELEYAKQAANIEPEIPLFIKRLAESHLQSGELKKSKQAAEQLVLLEPDDGDTFQLLGEINMEMGHHSEAEQSFRNALTFSPEDTALLNDLARSLMAQKQKLRESIDVLFNIIQLDPTNQVISDNLFIAVQSWLDRQKLKGKGSRSFSDLPAPVQLFFRDYQKRNSPFISWGKVVWGGIWVGALFLLTLLFSFVKN